MEFLPGKEGLVHVSHFADPAPRRPDNAVKLGDEIKVRVIEVDPQGRVNLSAIGLDQPFDPSNVKPREERGGGRGGDRGGFRGGGDRDPNRGPAPSSPAPAPEKDEDEMPNPDYSWIPRREQPPPHTVAPLSQ